MSRSASASTPATRTPPARTCRRGRRALAITGRIDLLHANDSRDEAGTGADRHANLGHGNIGADPLRAMIAAAGGPVVVETPGDLDDLRADVEFARAALGEQR